MFCPKCGNQLDDNAKFCTKCGMQMTPPEQPAPAPAPKQAKKESDGDSLLPKANVRKLKAGLEKCVYGLSAYLMIRMMLIWLTSGFSLDTGMGFGGNGGMGLTISVFDAVKLDDKTAINVITILLLIVGAVVCLLPLFSKKITKFVLACPVFVALWTFIWYIVEFPGSGMGFGMSFYGVVLILFAWAVIGMLGWELAKFAKDTLNKR